MQRWDQKCLCQCTLQTVSLLMTTVPNDWVRMAWVVRPYGVTSASSLECRTPAPLADPGGGGGPALRCHVTTLGLNAESAYTCLFVFARCNRAETPRPASWYSELSAPIRVMNFAALSLLSRLNLVKRGPWRLRVDCLNTRDTVNSGLCLIKLGIAFTRRSSSARIESK